MSKVINNVEDTRDIVENIADLLFQESQVNCELRHHFSDGVYVREITMPKDTIVLGHIHKTRHLNIISEGECLLSDIHTGEVTTLTGPCTFESEANVSKLLYIIEECVWSTVHVTNETDIDKLEEELVYDYNDVRKIGGINNVNGIHSSSGSSGRNSELSSRRKGSS